MSTSLTPICFGEGPLTAAIALVGEAPGFNEEHLKKPFVGLAGQLLTKLLSSVGLSRSEVYITNVVKQRPGKAIAGAIDENDISSWFSSRGDKVWTSEGFNAYVDLLRQELSRLSNMTVCVPMGNTALYALTGLTGIQKRRGSILKSTLLSTLKVVPTIHPSSALREYLHAYYIKHDLKRAIAESKTREISLPERNLLIRPGYYDSIDFLMKVASRDAVGVDIEVVNEEVSCISLCYFDIPWKEVFKLFEEGRNEELIVHMKGISVPFAEGARDWFSPDQEVDIWNMLTSILENPAIIKVFQNGIFDCSFMYRKYGIRTVNIEDTMIGQAVTRPDFPKGLDFITSIFTREPYYKDEGKKWFKIGGTYDSFWLYNAKDSAVCLESFPQIMEVAASQHNEETYHFQRMLIEPLMYMQARGLRVNHEGLKIASAEAEDRISSLTNELQQLCGFSINPNSPLQLKRYFYETKKIQPYYNKGTITTNDDAMKRLARRGIKEAILIRDIRKLSKLKGTYYDVTLSEDKRLRSAINPVGTRQGRLSSSEDIFGEGSNLQNLPDAMYKFILADEGYVIYNVDLSQAENRVTAYIAPDLLMQKAFSEGLDIHSITGGYISGLDPAEVKRQDKEGIKCPLGNGEDTWRFYGKKANHSLNYDLGYKSFGLKFELPEPQSKIIVDRYHQLYPGVRQYHAWIRAKLAQDRTLENCFGRKYIFLDRWGDELFKQAYSFIPQSTVADKINRHGLIYIYYNQEIFKEVELLNQVHDSIVFQIPISAGWDYHASVLLAMHKSLTEPITWHDTEFIIPAEFEMGLNLQDTKGIVIDGNTTVEGLSNQLLGIYEALGSSGQLSPMDSSISSGISPSA